MTNSALDLLATWPHNNGQMAQLATAPGLEQREEVVDMLGGKKLLGVSVDSQLKLMVIVRAGLPYRSVESVGDKLQLSDEAISAAIAISRRTLIRRKAEGRLSGEESDRLLRLARVASLAMETLGTPAKAARWLKKPNRALDNQTPLSMMDNDIGVRQVESLLDHIEYGLPA
jgi:putative toxin-antitoxin system antitoxin component (TIGR02293 family)